MFDCAFIFKSSTLLCMAIATTIVSPLFWLRFADFSDEIIQLLHNRTQKQYERSQIDIRCPTDWTEWTRECATTCENVRYRNNSVCHLDKQTMPLECPWNEHCGQLIRDVSPAILSNPDCLKKFYSSLNDTEPFILRVIDDKQEDVKNCPPLTTTTPSP
ncbi:hypothetical protein M3Y94_01043500 [Aphelenchoides besseyi]|nr:hypothetical protein M3Y94_01043500 [Aphelenchoides besseyi]